MARLPAGLYLRRPGVRIWSALVLAVLVAIVVALARLLGGSVHGGDGVDRSAVAPTSVSSTAPDDSVYDESSTVAPAAMSAAENFVRAWLQPTDGRSRASWYAGLVKYASPDLAAQLRDADPTSNPATRVTGAAVGATVTEESVRVVVPTNAGRATVLCVETDGVWRAATIDLGT